MVQIQNQTGPHANKWDMSSVVLESLDFDSYNVRVDDSGRASKRNRRFLRPIKSDKDTIKPVLVVDRPREPMDAPPRSEVVSDSRPFTNIIPEVHDEIRDDKSVPVEVPALRRSAREVRRPEKYGA